MRPLLLAVGLLLALSSMAAAQSTASRMADSEARERVARDRMWAARASGRISRWEQPRLDRLFGRLERLQRSAARDGVLTRRELERLEQLQDRLDRMITTAAAF